MAASNTAGETTGPGEKSSGNRRPSRPALDAVNIAMIERKTDRDAHSATTTWPLRTIGSRARPPDADDRRAPAIGRQRDQPVLDSENAEVADDCGAEAVIRDPEAAAARCSTCIVGEVLKQTARARSSRTGMRAVIRVDRFRLARPRRAADRPTVVPPTDAPASPRFSAGTSRTAKPERSRPCGPCSDVVVIKTSVRVRR